MPTRLQLPISFRTTLLLDLVGFTYQFDHAMAMRVMVMLHRYFHLSIKENVQEKLSRHRLQAAEQVTKVSASPNFQTQYNTPPKI